jgi:TolB protein
MTETSFVRRTVLSAGALSPLIFSPLSALAQFRVEVSGVGMTQIPLTVSGFRGNDGLPVDLAAVVRADLERSGRLRLVDVPLTGLDENSRPDLAPVKDRGSDALVVGSVSRLADGRQDVRFRLWDAVKAQDMGGQGFPVAAADLRLAAHRVSDYVYEKLTGEKGVFSTRIAYVSRSANRHQLWVADADGENARAALASPEPIISPAWSPNGQQLAYVSFEARKPVVYVHDVATGRRRLLASFRGTNSAPAWSPDGARLAMALSMSGNAQIYVMGVNGGEPRRLTQSSSIDTEPAFSPDGRSIYFVSDRGGSPQIYRMGAGGENPQRLTFSGNYNISPAPSPDGRLLAYVSRVGGAFRLHVMDLSNGQVTALTDTVADESPSFAPNSRLIIYATQLQGKEALMTCTPDGRVKTRLAGASGDIREPDWGPFLV